MITLVIADSRPVIRAGLRTLLSAAPEIQMVGEAENCNDVQCLVAELQPSVLALDLKIGGPSLFEIGQWVHANFPQTAILVLSAQNQDAYLASLIDVGIAGIISLETTADRLIDAIQGAARGEILFDQEQLDRAEQWRKVAGEKWTSLSRRQKQVLFLLAQGTTRGGVAEQLGIRPRMVDYHIGEFLKKLKFKSLVNAVNWMHKYILDDLGLITG